MDVHIGQQYEYKTPNFSLLVTLVDDNSKNGVTVYKLRLDEVVKGKVQFSLGSEFMAVHDPGKFALKLWELNQVGTMKVDEEE